jgi:hypothetical protein
MKSVLAEKLMSICSPDKDLPNDHNSDNTFGIDNLTDEQRTQVEEELIKHFGFERITWMNLPAGLTEDGNPIVAKTIKIHDTDNPDYADKVGYLYKVLFTPLVYDPNSLHQPIKDGCVITPVIYNPISFLPKRSVTIEWSPEFPQDIDNPVTWEDQKKMLHDKLETILENPDLFLPEGYRACLVRFAAV